MNGILVYSSYGFQVAKIGTLLDKGLLILFALTELVEETSGSCFARFCNRFSLRQKFTLVPLCFLYGYSNAI